MPTVIKKQEKTTQTHRSRPQVLKKLSKSTRAVMTSTILPLLKKKGASELTITELRKRLSSIKIPLSREIIEARRKV